MAHEDFVTYEQAVRLKELGFDWACNHYYDIETQEFIENHNDYSPEDSFSDCSSYDDHNGCWNCVSAPTLSLVQKWLMDKKYILISIRPNDFVNDSGNSEIHYVTDIFRTSKNHLELLHSEAGYENYEFALEEGITEALDLLNKK